MALEHASPLEIDLVADSLVWASAGVAVGWHLNMSARLRRSRCTRLGQEQAGAVSCHSDPEEEVEVAEIHHGELQM